MSVYQPTLRAMGAHFAANVTGPLELPTLWPNVTSIPPGTNLETTAWLRVTVNWQTSRSEIVQGATGRWRTRGEMVVSVFVPSDSGADRSGEITDAIVDVYRGLELGDISFTAAEVRRVGASGHWWQVNIHCPFYVDEVS